MARDGHIWAAAALSRRMRAPTFLMAHLPASVEAVTGPSFIGGVRVGLLAGIVLAGVTLVVARQPARALRVGGVLLTLVAALGVVHVASVMSLTH